jgi:hypothetical protein
MDRAVIEDIETGELVETVIGILTVWLLLLPSREVRGCTKGEFNGVENPEADLLEEFPGDDGKE